MRDLRYGTFDVTAIDVSFESLDVTAIDVSFASPSYEKKVSNLMKIFLIVLCPLYELNYSKVFLALRLENLIKLTDILKKILVPKVIYYK
jgi:hypothetical protein